MQVEKVEWGGLASYVVRAEKTNTSARLVVVLCHGYGAPATDLAGLASSLISLEPNLADDLAFVFPGAPLDLAEQGLPGGRAWWHVDIDRLVNRRTPELLVEFRRACPVGLDVARSKLVALLDEAAKHFGLTADRFILGGFSQGAMLTTDVALRLKKAPAGLCILSGALINEGEWSQLAKGQGKLPVFQSHGHYDSILPFVMGESLRDMLQAAGADVEFFSFGGDHEIPRPVVQRMASFISRLSE
jgi:phospholipase/carboxylesterase